jgi:hypothetical protein
MRVRCHNHRRERSCPICRRRQALAPGVSAPGYLLVLGDLVSGCQPAWLPVLDDSVDSSIDAIQQLFLEHGPSLVLKVGSGSGFITEETRRFFDRWRVLPRFSPTYMPEYNGAREVSIH